MSYKSIWFVVSAGLALFIFLTASANAISKADIAFPVAELGNCSSEETCRTYCDQPANFAGCFAFAKKHDLIKGPIADKSVNEIRQLSAKLQEKGGPGGCRTHNECQSFCDQLGNIEACFAYAEKEKILDKAELAEVQKIKSALGKGAKMPGGCTSKDSCEKYCFGGDGARGGKFNPARLDECVSFGVKAGFMTPEEGEMVKKTGGEGPGGCRGQECRKFCDDLNNHKECFQFAEKHGLISPEEGGFARKVMEKTGCRSRRECEAQFKDDPEKAEDLFEEISKETGFDLKKFIPKSQLGKIKNEIRSRIEDELPEDVFACAGPKIDEFLNSEEFSPFEAGAEIGPIIEGCFSREGFGPPDFENEGDVEEDFDDGEGDDGEGDFEEVFEDEDGDFEVADDREGDEGDEGFSGDEEERKVPEKVAICLGPELTEKMNSRQFPLSPPEEEAAKKCFEGAFGLGDKKDKKGKGDETATCQIDPCANWRPDTRFPEDCPIKAPVVEVSCNSDQCKNDPDCVPAPSVEKIDKETKNAPRLKAESESTAAKAAEPTPEQKTLTAEETEKFKAEKKSMIEAIRNNLPLSAPEVRDLLDRVEKAENPGDLTALKEALKNLYKEFKRGSSSGYQPKPSGYQSGPSDYHPPSGGEYHPSEPHGSSVIGTLGKGIADLFRGLILR